MFREGNENYKMKSHGRARKNEANSRENSRDREFSLVSGSHTNRKQIYFPTLTETSLQCNLPLLNDNFPDGEIQ